MEILPFVKDSCAKLFLKPIADSELTEVTETAIWKNAKEMQLESKQSVSLRKLVHFQSGRVYEGKVTTGELVEIIPELLKKDDFHELALYSIDYDKEAFVDYLRRTYNFGRGNTCHVRLPNCANTLKIRFERLAIKFTSVAL